MKLYEKLLLTIGLGSLLSVNVKADENVQNSTDNVKDIKQSEHIVSPKDVIDNLSSSVKFFRVDMIPGLEAEHPSLHYGANYEALTDDNKPLVIVASFNENLANEANFKPMAFATHLMGYDHAIAEGDLAITPQQQREIQLFQSILHLCYDNGEQVLNNAYDAANKANEALAKEGKKLSEHQKRLFLAMYAEKSMGISGCDGTGTNKYTFAYGVNEQFKHPSSQQDFDMVMNDIAGFYKELMIKDATNKYSEELKANANKETKGKKGRKNASEEQIEPLSSVLSRVSMKASEVINGARTLASEINKGMKSIDYSKENIAKNKNQIEGYTFEELQRMGEKQYINGMRGNEIINSRHAEEINRTSNSNSSSVITAYVAQTKGNGRN